MKERPFFTIALIIVTVFLLSFSVWAVPGLINYQGKLTDSGGVPLNGIYLLKFYLFNQETEGIPLWSEQQEITLTDGIYNVELGTVNTLNPNLFENVSLYLEVEIFNSGIGWETLSPRACLTSTAFAMKAANADTLDGQDSTNFAEVSHAHGGGDITTGTIAETHIDATVTRDNEVMGIVMTNDGQGSGLNADLLDGYDSSMFIRSDNDYGRYNVTANLYEGVDKLEDKYVNDDGDKIIGSTSGYILEVRNTGRGIVVHADAENGIGVHSVTSGSASIPFFGFTDALGGKGIHAQATHSGAGINYGGYFEAQGGAGKGVYGYAGNSGNVANYGGYFVANGVSGKGVYGEAYNSGGPVGVFKYGGYFIANRGNRGCGVYGGGSSYGGLFASPLTGVCSNSDECGGYFEASTGTGVRSWGSDYDFYAGGPGKNYGPFTGSHEVKLSNNFPIHLKPGMIVSVTGKTQVRSRENGTVILSSTLPTVKLSDVTNDKAVIGVFVNEAPLPEGHWYQSKDGERFAAVNAIGEGRVWVSNMNGNIQAGDYITSSSIPGYGQKQDDDLLHSYTLGKAIETVDFDSATEVIEFKNNTYKIYLIAVVYTSG